MPWFAKQICLNLIFSRLKMKSFQTLCGIYPCNFKHFRKHVTSPISQMSLELPQNILNCYYFQTDNKKFKAEFRPLYVSGASSPPRQPRQLPWLIFETTINYKKWHKQLGRFEGKNLYFSTKQKNSLNILCLFLKNWKNKCYSTKQKIFLTFLYWVFFAKLKKAL